MSETPPVVTEEKKEESILDKVTSAFSTATDAVTATATAADTAPATLESEGVGPEIGEVLPPVSEPAVVSPDESATEAPATQSVSEPFTAPTPTFGDPESEATPPAFAPLDSMSTDTKKKKGTKKNKKNCKCPTKKQKGSKKKLPRCKRGRRSKKTRKCKGAKKCPKGSKTDPSTGACTPK